MKTTTFAELLLLSLLVSCLPSLNGATTDPDEVKALRNIGKTLGKDWDFNVDPCSQNPNWTTDFQQKDVLKNYVHCNCSIPGDNFCHVIIIYLAGQNLQGSLPKELAGLPYIQEIDFSRNYLNGTIPQEWETLKFLNSMELVGNRLSGPFPKVLANITSLKNLILESNNFSGKLPPELGHLPHLERLLLNSNNFTGEWPETFSNLTTLIDVRLGGNQFSGKIPNFIERWRKLQILDITGSGLEGPFPSAFSFLQNLTQLEVTDLNGPVSTFPSVNLTQLKRLILRNCNIKDTIPEYIGNLKSLKILDLSYNKLSGKIPNTFIGLTDANIYLTGNFLTGSRDEWSLPSKTIDLSYNNFTNDNQEAPECQDLKKNLFASFSSQNNSGPVSCTTRTKCLRPSYSFHINCGGNEITTGDTKYDRDYFSSSSEGAAIYTNWGISNTGFLLDSDSEAEAYQYTVQNISRLSMSDAEAKLYMSARMSPLSLTYYGFCLVNGNYTVRLHFAEIMFTDDNTYKSLGRRIFDVYIQGKRVLKDFNIADKAQGTGKAHIENFTASVSNTTLEIRFFWAGKGSTGIPKRSVYGPLISAISVTSDSKPPSPPPRHKWVVVVIGVVTSIILIVVVGILWWRFCLKNNNSLAKEFKDLDLKTGLFTLRQIKVATNNFNISNKIGEGGFGPVYKGILWDGTMIAVKQLSSKSKQGNREFVNEIGLISALNHPCLVKLYGCCVEGDQLFLVYEYLENNSLARALFGSEELCLKLNWPTRQKICIGIARGLAFLHEESRFKVVHRDIKATNVLLDKDLNPKISDFGLAKLDEEDNTHISTRIAGTYGYMAPEYAMHGYLTDKADVYSFGIVALEIVSGKSNIIRRSKEETMVLLDWAHMLKEEGKLMELVDERLGSNFDEEEAMVMINVALLCTNVTSNLRPAMSSVVSVLEGKSFVSEFVSDRSEVMDEMKLEAMRQHYKKVEQNEITLRESQSLSIEWPSSSSADLYPIDHNSSYLETRKLRDSI